MGKGEDMSRQVSLLDSLLEAPRPLTVSEFTEQVKVALETRFAEVWLEGEISNFKRHSSGHWYFTLKDAGAQVRCASFRNSNRYIRFLPEDGMLVRARGRLSLYEPRGEYQILVTSIEPVGVGALQKAFEQLKARLAAEGLFDEDRKRPIPRLPRRVGIVTSPTGAAIKDFLRILHRRNSAVSVVVAPARVQGEGAVDEVVRGIELLDALGDVDVIVVGRGGGSLEDLWAFNEERLVRAIAASKVPVISAVGHETDFTIADFVADLRAPTPSAAAELVASAASEVRDQIDQLRAAAVASVRYRILEARSAVRDLRHDYAMRSVPGALARHIRATDEARELLVETMRRRMADVRDRLSRAAAVMAGSDPRRRLLVERARVAASQVDLSRWARRAVETRRERLALLEGTLSSLSPLDVLLRGYALVRDENGRVVRSPADVAPGERIQVRVADGEFKAIRED